MTVAIDYIDDIRRLMLRPCARFRGVCICHGCACVFVYYRCAANITIASGYIVYVRGVCVCVCVRARVCVCVRVCVCAVRHSTLRPCVQFHRVCFLFICVPLILYVRVIISTSARNYISNVSACASDYINNISEKKIWYH